MMSLVCIQLVLGSNMKRLWFSTSFKRAVPYASYLSPEQPFPVSHHLVRLSKLWVWMTELCFCSAHLIIFIPKAFLSLLLSQLPDSSAECKRNNHHQVPPPVEPRRRLRVIFWPGFQSQSWPWAAVQMLDEAWREPGEFKAQFPIVFC